MGVDHTIQLFDNKTIIIIHKTKHIGSYRPFSILYLQIAYEFFYSFYQLYILIYFTSFEDQI